MVDLRCPPIRSRASSEAVSPSVDNVMRAPRSRQKRDPLAVNAVGGSMVGRKTRRRGARAGT